MINTQDIDIKIPQQISDDKSGFVLKKDLLNNKKIVGLIGFSGSGKDTVADYLVENNGFTKIKFADSLKQYMNYYLIDLIHSDMTSKGVDISVDKINFFSEDRSVKEIIRPYIIWFGEYIRENNGTFYWMNKLIEKTENYEKVVIADVRRVDELVLFADGNNFKEKSSKTFEQIGYTEYDDKLKNKNPYDSYLFMINQYGLEDFDLLTHKAVVAAQRDWFVDNHIFIDSRLPVEHRKSFIDLEVGKLAKKYSL